MPETKQWKLEPKTEFRFELEQDESISLKLVEGRAEVFGAELPLDRVYLFDNECKAAVFTWHGCTLEVSGHASAEYVAEETPMAAYVNCHLALEQMRVKSVAYERYHSKEALFGERPQPPCILIIGPEDSGKSTAAKILLNYALRSGQSWSPLMVNLDVLDGAWTAPGTISACQIALPVLTTSAANPFGSTATSAPTSLMFSALLPLVYWFGHFEVKRNLDLMQRLARRLAGRVDDHLLKSSTSAAGGVIIDTPAAFSVPSPGGAVDKYPLVTACVENFGVNMILVVGNEKLNVEMQRKFAKSQTPITVVKVPKSGGVVDIDAASRRRLIFHQLRSYFYGRIPKVDPSADSSAQDADTNSDITLAPVSSVINFGDLTIYRIGEESMAPSSALPIGASRVLSTIQPVMIDPASASHRTRLLNAVLGLLPPIPLMNVMDDNATDKLLDQSVAGFLVITSIDQENRKMTVLSPSATPLEGRIAILGSVEWQDS